MRAIARNVSRSNFLSHWFCSWAAVTHRGVLRELFSAPHTYLLKSEWLGLNGKSTITKTKHTIQNGCLNCKLVGRPFS